jgi:hypothetical protein
MATIPQTNVSMDAIDTENTTYNPYMGVNVSLKALSDNATTGTDPKDGAPYGMGEFRGYTHIQTWTTTATMFAQHAKPGSKYGISYATAADSSVDYRTDSLASSWVIESYYGTSSEPLGLRVFNAVPWTSLSLSWSAGSHTIYYSGGSTTYSWAAGSISLSKSSMNASESPETSTTSYHTNLTGGGPSATGTGNYLPGGSGTLGAYGFNLANASITLTFNFGG